MSEIFGEKLRQQRTAKGLTLEGLAVRIDSTKAYVWQLENKKPARPSAELLLKIADALGVSPDYLIDDSAQEPSKDQFADALYRKIKNKKLTKSDMEKLMAITDTLGRKNEADKRRK